MKKIILLASGVVVMTLMSFGSGKNTDVIEVKGNEITIKDIRKISKADLEFLSANVAGWTYCDRSSSSKTCDTKNRTFPNSVEAKTEVEKIIAKYQ